MKQCPNCSQLFNDEEFFCENDGTPLVLYDLAEQTVIVQTPNINSQPYPAPPSQNNVQSKNPLIYLLFGAILLLLMVVAGLGVAFYYEKNKELNAEKIGNKAAEKTNEPTPFLENSQKTPNLTKVTPTLLPKPNVETLPSQTNRLEVINPSKFRRIFVNQQIPICQDSFENCGMKTLELLGLNKGGKVETFIYPTKVGVYLVSHDISDDDSTIGERVRVAFLIKQEGYEFVQVGVQNKCSRGVNANKWTKNSCN